MHTQALGPSCQTYLHTAVVAVAVTLHCCPCCRRCHSPCHCLCRAAATADMSGAGGVGAEQEKATTEEGLGGGRATGGTGAHCCGHKAGHANGVWAILQMQEPSHCLFFPPPILEVGQRWHEGNLADARTQPTTYRLPAEKFAQGFPRGASPCVLYFVFVCCQGTKPWTAVFTNTCQPMVAATTKFGLRKPKTGR